MKTRTANAKRVNITLPAKTLGQLDRYVARGDRSRLIDQAIRFYVREIGRRRLADALKREALQRAPRDLDIAAEWFCLEEETWPEKSR